MLVLTSLPLLEFRLQRTWWTTPPHFVSEELTRYRYGLPAYRFTQCCYLSMVLPSRGLYLVRLLRYSKVFLLLEAYGLIPLRRSPPILLQKRKKDSLASFFSHLEFTNWFSSQHSITLSNTAPISQGPVTNQEVTGRFVICAVRYEEKTIITYKEQCQYVQHIPQQSFQSVRLGHYDLEI